MRLSILSFNLAILSVITKAVAMLLIGYLRIDVFASPSILLLWYSASVLFDLSGILVGLVLGLNRFASSENALLTQPFRMVGKVLLFYFLIGGIFSLLQLVVTVRGLVENNLHSDASYVTFSILFIVPFLLGLLLIPMFLLVRSSPEILGSSSVKLYGSAYFGLNVFSVMFLTVGLGMASLSLVSGLLFVILGIIWILFTRAVKNMRVSYDKVAMGIEGTETYDL